MVVEKVTFDRKVFGRLAKQRKEIEKSGVSPLQIDFEEFTETMEARATGSEESVSRALIKMIEFADGCGFSPSNWYDVLPS